MPQAIGAVVGVGAGLLGARQQKKAAKGAAAAQLAGQELAIGEQRRQFDIAQQQAAPFREAGLAALNEQLQLLGLPTVATTPAALPPTAVAPTAATPGLAGFTGLPSGFRGAKAPGAFIPRLSRQGPQAITTGAADALPPGQEFIPADALPPGQEFIPADATAKPLIGRPLPRPAGAPTVDATRASPLLSGQLVDPERFAFTPDETPEFTATAEELAAEEADIPTVTPGQEFIRERQRQALLRSAGAIGGLGGGRVRTALQQQAAGFAQQDIQFQREAERQARLERAARRQFQQQFRQRGLVLGQQAQRQAGLDVLRASQFQQQAERQAALDRLNALRALTGGAQQATGQLGQLGAQAAGRIGAAQIAGGQAQAQGILGAQQARQGLLGQIGAAGLGAGLGASGALGSTFGITDGKLTSTPVTAGQGALLGLLSDRNLKTDIKDLDTKACFEVVQSMPLKIWRYLKEIGLGEDLHLGPMAQDAPEMIKIPGQLALSLHDELMMIAGAIQYMGGKND